MKQLKNAFFSSGFVLLLPVLTEAQIDIYQSDAYSLEEMCAREAEQNAEFDYTEAYESCLANNRENPMYQADTAADTLIDNSAENSTDQQSANESQHLAAEEYRPPEEPYHPEPYHPEPHSPEQYHSENSYE